VAGLTAHTVDWGQRAYPKTGAFTPPPTHQPRPWATTQKHGRLNPLQRLAEGRGGCRPTRTRDGGGGKEIPPFIVLRAVMHISSHDLGSPGPRLSERGAGGVDGGGCSRTLPQLTTRCAAAAMVAHLPESVLKKRRTLEATQAKKAEEASAAKKVRSSSHS
jgi:hypothetical protein